MDKVKALLTPAPAKALAGRELILVTKDVAGTSLCTPEQLSQTCGHQECSWKGSGSLDGPPSDVLPKVALHPAGSMTSRLLAGYFIKCFQQASNYQMQLPLNTLECYMRDDVLLRPQGSTPISGLLSLPGTQINLPLLSREKPHLHFSAPEVICIGTSLSPANTLITHPVPWQVPHECTIRDRASPMSHSQNQPCHCCCIPGFSLLIPA